MEYNAPTGSTDPDASYADGNPSAGIRGSRVPAAAVESPQREIVTCIVNSAQTPDGGDHTQLWDAILWAIAQYGGGTSGGGAYLPLAGGALDSGASANTTGGGVWKVNGLPVWHPQNDGSGSGLDADLLGGVANANFARNNRDSEPVANGKVRFVRRPLEGNRGRVEVLGQDTQNGGGQIDWLSGDGTTLSGRDQLDGDRRTRRFQMYSDGGNTTFEDQARLTDVGDLWLRKLGGTVVDALAGRMKLIGFWAPYIGSGKSLNATSFSGPTTYDGDQAHLLIGAKYGDRQDFSGEWTYQAGGLVTMDYSASGAPPAMSSANDVYGWVSQGPEWAIWFEIQ